MHTHKQDKNAHTNPKASTKISTLTFQENTKTHKKKLLVAWTYHATTYATKTKEITLIEHTATGGFNRVRRHYKEIIHDEI